MPEWVSYFAVTSTSHLTSIIAYKAGQYINFLLCAVLLPLCVPYEFIPSVHATGGWLMGSSAQPQPPLPCAS